MIHNQRKHRPKILTRTSSKVIIKLDKLVDALNEEEIHHFHHILEKLRKHDELLKK